MAGVIVGAVAARPVVAERAHAADVPAHLEFVLAAHPAQLLRDMRSPVPLAALVHFTLVHTPRCVTAVQAAGHGQVGCEGDDRGSISLAGQGQADLRRKTTLQRVVPILYLPGETPSGMQQNRGREDMIVIDAIVV